MIIGLIAHLWQSTLFAGVAWLAALTLQKNQAKVRYWAWFTASVKFLIPFALLVRLGTFAPHRAVTPTVQAKWGMTVEQIGQPLALPSAAAGEIAATNPNYRHLTVAGLALWAFGFVTVAASRILRWKRVQALRNMAKPLSIPRGSVPVMSVPGMIEPGIFGIVRPVLLLPEGIADRLDQNQLDTILAHEYCHFRRKDNLTAAIHMIVQAIFWFHPLTWWIGARLIDEREKACDEEVLGLGYKPSLCAESILAICKLYLESPLACVSGVTGSDLKRRIEAILKNHLALNLSLGKKVVLATAGMATLALPIAVGILHAQDESDWQVETGGKMAFEVASVKPTRTPKLPSFPLDDRNAKPPGGRFSASFPLWIYISFAYKLSPNEEERRAGMVQLSKVVGTDLYEIEARAEGNPTKDQMRLMMQSLLAERFKLKVHFESREVPVFALTLVKPSRIGPKLRPHSEGPPCPDSYMQPELGPPPTVGDLFPPNCETAMMSVRNGMRLFGSRNTTMSLLAEAIYSTGIVAREIDKPVVDQTGLKGKFDFTVEYAAGDNDLLRRAGAPPPDAPRPDSQGVPFLNAVREQLGLKLVSSKGTIKTLIIDHVEKPPEN